MLFFSAIELGGQTLYTIPVNDTIFLDHAVVENVYVSFTSMNTFFNPAFIEHVGRNNSHVAGTLRANNLQNVTPTNLMVYVPHINRLRAFNVVKVHCLKGSFEYHRIKPSIH